MEWLWRAPLVRGVENDPQWQLVRSRGSKRGRCSLSNVLGQSLTNPCVDPLERHVVDFRSC